MSHNWKIIRKKLFGTLASPGRGMNNIAMYDEAGNRTIEPLDATRFFVSFSSNDPKIETFTILVAIRDEGQLSHVDIKTPDLSNEKDFDLMLDLLGVIRKTVGDREGIKINWQDFEGSIDPREEAVNNIKESKDVGRLTGTTKSSFQRIGTARLILRHTETVNEELHGSRTRHIRAIFIENKLGERFNYPHMHLTGARAFARHISQGGANHDDVSQKIISLSEDYMSLKRAAKMLRTAPSADQTWVESVRAGMHSINRSLKSMQGPKRYQEAAQDLLKESSGIIDQSEIANLHAKLAECCMMAPDSPSYSDLGTAAKYITGMPRMTSPMVFTWSRRPDIARFTQGDLNERLHSQVMELARACTNEEAAAQLANIAEMIKNGTTPSAHQVDFVKEALAKGLEYEPEVNVLAEEMDLERFLEDFDPARIFAAEAADDQDRYLPGIQGEIIDRAGEHVLVHDTDDYGDVIKHEYRVYRQDGTKWTEVENLNEPYDRKGIVAVDKFRSKYGPTTESESEAVEQDIQEADSSSDELARIKNLAGI